MKPLPFPPWTKSDLFFSILWPPDIKTLTLHNALWVLMLRMGRGGEQVIPVHLESHNLAQCLPHHWWKWKNERCTPGRECPQGWREMDPKPAAPQALRGLKWAVTVQGGEGSRAQDWGEPWEPALVYLIFSVRIPRNQCSFLKHCCPEPPSLLDSRVGIKYLSIYKATLTAVVQCRFHTQPQRWERVGQKEKLRPSKQDARNTRKVSMPERLFSLPWTPSQEGLLTS